VLTGARLGTLGEGFASVGAHVGAELVELDGADDHLHAMFRRTCIDREAGPSEKDHRASWRCLRRDVDRSRQHAPEQVLWWLPHCQVWRRPLAMDRLRIQAATLPA
jgi:hypothetical protein